MESIFQLGHPCCSVILFLVAGAGPIVGPFWLPTSVGGRLGWILIGAILVGGVHDFGVPNVRTKRRPFDRRHHHDLVGEGQALYALRGSCFDLSHHRFPRPNRQHLRQTTGGCQPQVGLSSWRSSSDF